MKLRITLLELIQSEGIELRKSGKAYKGHCPFHEDKNPSFYVYPDSNRFICFGCGEKGDVIDFIMKLYNLTFKEALSHPLIKGKYKTPRKNSDTIVKQQLIKGFRKWQNDYYDKLASLYRTNYSTMRRIKSMDEAKRIAFIYHEQPILEYRMDILIYGSDEEKFDLFNEVMVNGG